MTLSSKSLGIFLLLLLFHSIALACSGQGAGEEMYSNKSMGRMSFFICTGLSAITAYAGSAYNVMRRPGHLLLLLLLAAHPNIWIGVQSGDCGRTLFVLSWVAIAVFAIFFAVVSYRAYKSRKKE
jgi:hypothetical protein